MKNEREIYKHIFSNLYKAVFGEQTEPTEVKLAETIEVTKDGETIQAQIISVTEGEINVGDAFNIVGEGDEISAATAGEYIYNGVIYVVDEAGKIAEVKQEETEIEEESEEMESEENYEAQLISQISEMIKEFRNLKGEFQSLKAENKLLKENFEKFSSQPAETKTSTEIKFSDINGGSKKSLGLLQQMVKK